MSRYKILSLKVKTKILKEFVSIVLTKVELTLKKVIPVSSLKSTVYGSENFEDLTKAFGSSASKILRVQEGKFSEVTPVFHLVSNVPVSRPMFMEKAKEIVLKMNASAMELRVKLPAVKQKMFQLVESDAELYESFSNIISTYVFNADETSFFYHLITTQT